MQTMTRNQANTIKATIEPCFSKGAYGGWSLHLFIKPNQGHASDHDMRNDHGMFLAFNSMPRALDGLAIINEGRKIAGRPAYEIVEADD